MRILATSRVATSLVAALLVLAATSVGATAERAEKSRANEEPLSPRLRARLRESVATAAEGLNELLLWRHMRNKLDNHEHLLLSEQTAPNAHQSARQSSFLSSLGLGTPSMALPMMAHMAQVPPGGFRLQTPANFAFPAAPSFSLFAPKPPPQAKSSLLSNNAGPTALTNDNIVVVNVLSNNGK